MLLGREDGLECQICVDGIRLKNVLEFKYLGCILDESPRDEAECSRKVTSEKSVARSLQLECARVLHESLLVPVPTYGSEKMIWKEKEKSRIWAIQMVNLRGLMGIRRRDKVPNARIKQLCGVTKGVDEKVDKNVLRWSGHAERMENC